MICVLCSRPIERPSDAFRRVIGWERKANSSSRKGGSDITLREALDEYACASCITRLRAGLNVAQESLV